LSIMSNRLFFCPAISVIYAIPAAYLSILNRD
jgi:hypothetical protein